MALHNANEPKHDVEYMLQEGAFAIIQDDSDLIVVINASGNYYLPGGPIANKKNPLDSLREECLKDTGYSISIHRYLGESSYFFYSTTWNRYIESKGHFYICAYDELVEEVSHKEYDVTRLSLKDAKNLLKLKHQRRAVSRVMDLK